MPKYNVKIAYMSGFKDAIWANDKEEAFNKFLTMYKLNKSFSYITDIQEIFNLKGEFDE